MYSSRAIASNVWKIAKALRVEVAFLVQNHRRCASFDKKLEAIGILQRQRRVRYRQTSGSRAPISGIRRSGLRVAVFGGTLSRKIHRTAVLLLTSHIIRSTDAQEVRNLVDQGSRARLVVLIVPERLSEVHRVFVSASL